jgi:surfeit locus 1 family protein
MTPLRNIRFRPRLVPSVAAAVFIVITIGLGSWQTHRAEEKLKLQEKKEHFASLPPIPLPGKNFDGGEYSQRAVFVVGEFLPAMSLYIDNRIYRGQAGYHVVTPLKVQGAGDHVLVNRGWIPAGTDRSRLPVVATSAGTIKIEGIAVAPPSNAYELAPDTTPGPLRQNLVLPRIASDFRLDLRPIVLLQTSDTADGLVRDWPKPSAGADVNRAYALQWYAMALVAFVLWLALNFKQKAMT